MRKKKFFLMVLLSAAVLFVINGCSKEEHSGKIETKKEVTVQESVSQTDAADKTKDEKKQEESIEEVQLEVNYNRDIKDMILACHTEEMDGNIPKFLLELKDLKFVRFALFPCPCAHLHPFARAINEVAEESATEEVEQTMRVKGWRPATFRELLAFAEDNERTRNLHRIVALGSTWLGTLGRDKGHFRTEDNDFGRRQEEKYFYHPYLYIDFGKRFISLDSNFEWDRENTRFLAVHE